MSGGLEGQQGSIEIRPPHFLQAAAAFLPGGMRSAGIR
jgi:hypothetical protein